MKEYDILIIGCGASGTMCALSSNKKNIAIIDNNFTPAKKLLATGNGKCNLTNLNCNSTFYNVNIDKYLNRFNVKNTLNFFEEKGLIWHSDNEGRVYPISNSAKSVVDVLTINLAKHADLYLDEKVLNVEFKDNKFIVTTNKNTFKSNKLVVALGGNSINEIFKDTNLKIESNYPSLVSLKSDEIKNLNGIRISNVKVTGHYKNQTKVEEGEILFKENGISGISIFNISTLFSRNKDFNGYVVIDLLPNFSKEKIIETIENRKKLNVPLSKFFIGFMQNSIADLIIKKSKLNYNINSKNLSLNQIETIADTIKNLTFKINGAYENNQVYSGGVDLNDLDDNLMHKHIKCLYFIGEACNVDGECGGFNLQWAWTSGHIVGKSL